MLKRQFEGLLETVSKSQPNSLDKALDFLKIESHQGSEELYDLVNWIFECRKESLQWNGKELIFDWEIFDELIFEIEEDKRLYKEACEMDIDPDWGEEDFYDPWK